MPSIERRRWTGAPGASHYFPVDPRTLGWLRILKIGDVELHLDEHRLLIRGTPICLPHKEFVILQQLMNNAGRVVTRRELLDNA
jgi:DNA-binding response OmpR family regulator